MSAALTVADVLERAADLIEPEGAWTQGRYGILDARDRYRCFCMYGAVTQATRELHADDAWGWLDQNMESPTGRGWISWNDERGRTQRQVVAKLREAAALAKARGQ